MAISHEYFGEIDTTEEVMWETTVSLNDDEVEISLINDSNNPISQPPLDKSAIFIQTLAEVDTNARQALMDYLTENDEFIEFYLEYADDYIEESETLADFFASDKTVESFVERLKFISTSLYIEDDKNMATLDYMIDPEVTDQILCVVMDLDKNVNYVTWES